MKLPAAVKVVVATTIAQTITLTKTIFKILNSTVTNTVIQEKDKMLNQVNGSKRKNTNSPLKNNNPEKYTLVKDILWASPLEIDLDLDIYTPKCNQTSYPVIVMFHGGGWLMNNKSIMDQAAAYLATNANYVVCNVDYRLLSDNGNTINLNDIINDAMGAVLWVKENIYRYQGDKNRVIVTGDSAGGHLAAMIVNSGHLLSSKIFSEKSLAFTPSYLPEGKTPADIANEGGLKVQAAILSYGAFDIVAAADGLLETILNPFWLTSASLARGILGKEFNIKDNLALYEAVSPIHTIPLADNINLPPQLLTVGSKDALIKPKFVKKYFEALKAAGQPASYWEHEGRNHAFLDSGSNFFLQSTFDDDAPEAIDKMISFLDSIFYLKELNLE